jgi:hypothetical protein
MICFNFQNSLGGGRRLFGSFLDKRKDGGAPIVPEPQSQFLLALALIRFSRYLIVTNNSFTKGESRIGMKVGSATWNALAKRYNQLQLVDVVATVGQYSLVSMMLALARSWRTAYLDSLKHKINRERREIETAVVLVPGRARDGSAFCFKVSNRNVQV